MDSVAQYQIAEVVRAGTYVYYGSELVHYKVTFDTGEIVVIDRRSDTDEPQVSEIVTGIIERDKVVKLNSGSYPKFRPKALPKVKADTDKVNTAGIQVYAAWLEANRAEPITAEDFIADFKTFQDLLK